MFSVIHKVFRIQTTKKSEVLLQAFKTHVKPLLDYGTAILNPYKCKNVEKIEEFQNDFTRKVIIRTVLFLQDCIPTAKKRSLTSVLRTPARRRQKFDLLPFHKILRIRLCLYLEVFFPERSCTRSEIASKSVMSRIRIHCRSHFCFSLMEVFLDTYASLEQRMVHLRRLMNHGILTLFNYTSVRR